MPCSFGAREGTKIGESDRPSEKCGVASLTDEGASLSSAAFLRRRSARLA